MIRQKKYLLQKAFLLIASLMVNSLVGQYSQLTLFPEKGHESVFLPFAYKHLTLEEKDKSIWIPEHFFTTLNTGTVYEFALVGPLQPCILITVKNDENGKIIVVHKHWTNSIDEIVRIITYELEITNNTDRSQLHAQLFTHQSSDYDTFCNIISEGRTQKKELLFVKNVLKRKLSLDKQHIKACICSGNQEGNLLGDYAFADLFVLVDSAFNIYSICPMHENFFGNFNNLPLVFRRPMITYIAEQIRNSLFDQYLQKNFAKKVFSKNDYNTLSIKKFA